MFNRHFLTIVLRNIRYSKYYYFVNVSGLVIGLTCALLFFGYVLSEFQYDKHHEESEDIYRIGCSTVIDGKQTDFANMPPAFGPAIAEHIPEIEHMARVSLPFPINNGRSNVTFEDEQFYQDNIYMADSTLFDILSFDFIIGDKKALAAPGSILLTDELARKLFKSVYISNPDEIIGQSVELDGHEFFVGAVVQNPPFSSHLQPAAFISWVGLGVDEIWDDSQAYTYVKLRETVSLGTLYAKLERFVADNENIEEVSERFGASVRLIPEPVSFIHLGTTKEYEMSRGIQWAYIYSFIIMGLFFILSTSINYLNLALAISARRFSEVGVRKVHGASRGELVKHFLYESIVIVLFALLISLLLFYLLLPTFNNLLSYRLSPAILINGKFILLMFATIAVVVLLSGGYPAVYLSSVNPLAVLKNKAGNNPGKNLLRRTLLVVQFVMTGVVITFTLAVRNQLNFIHAKDLGFQKENTVILRIPDAAGVILHTQALKVALLERPHVKVVATTDFMPGASNMVDEHRVERANGEMRSSTIARLFVDEDFMKLLSLDITRGRSFERSEADFQGGFIVNESAVKEFGWDQIPGGPLGKEIEGFNYGKKGTVIGVIKDVNLFSLKQKVRPLILSLSAAPFFMYVKFDAPPGRQEIEDLQATFASVFEGPFEYTILDQQYARLYEQEDRMNSVLFVGTVLLLVVSAIGLFSLSLYIISRQTREIGIRKILGADNSYLVQQLSKKYVFQVLIANVIAFPISFVLMNRWLEEYANKAFLPWWLFVIPVLATVVIALLSVSHTIFSVGKVNPVEVLKYE